MMAAGVEVVEVCLDGVREVAGARSVRAQNKAGTPDAMSER